MAEINVNLTTVDNLKVNYVLGEFNTNGAVGGISSSIQYNDSGTLSGTANLTYAAGTTTASNLTVTGNLVAGDVSLVKISGGSNGQVLTTDGNGNLTWGPGAGNAIPHIRWNALSNGGGQSFSNALIASYTAGNLYMNVTRNGVLVNPDNYTIVGSTITFANFLRVGDYIDVLATSPVATTGGGGGSGTVTSITGNGSGLGFSLTGTVTTTGNITLTAPGVGDLRTNLGIGTAANVNLNGNTNEVIRGDGTLGVANYATWSGKTPGHWLPNANITYDLGSANLRWRDIYLSNSTIYLGDAGSISSDANGVVMGDASMANLTITDVLSANTITGDGANLANITGANVVGKVSSAASADVADEVALANVVGVGNIANINIDGNVGNVLTGNGTFTGRLGITGNTRELLFNGNGTISGSNGYVWMASDPGAASLQVIRQSGTTALFGGHAYLNGVGTGTFFAQRARGNVTNPAPLQVGDIITGMTSTYYTGNGTTNVTSLFGNTTGWVSNAPYVNFDVQSLPTSNGSTAGTRLVIRTTSNANVNYFTSINQDGNLNSPGNIIATGNVSGANISGNIYAGGTIPASATAPGVAGQIVADSQYIYYCSAANTWVRAPLSTW